MSSGWVTAIAIVGCLALLAVVALDRNRMRRRLDDTLGSLSGLRHDIDVAQQRISQLQSYLSRHESWTTDAVTPAHLAAPPDRPAGPAPSDPPAQSSGPGREQPSTSTPAGP